MIPTILKKSLGAKGSLEADLLLHWKEVVGEEHARWMVPARISYANRKMRRNGALEVSVAPAYAPMAEMAKMEIISRVNQFLGHGRVSKLVLKQTLTTPHAGSDRTVTGRGVAPSPYGVEARRERRQNEDLDTALETLRRTLLDRDSQA